MTQGNAGALRRALSCSLLASLVWRLAAFGPPLVPLCRQRRQRDAFATREVDNFSRRGTSAANVGRRPYLLGLRLTSPDSNQEKESALSELIRLANETVADSYRIMDNTNEGNSPRSASGGTTWADGGWVLSKFLPDLRILVNNTCSDRAAWAWLEKSRRPFYIELLRSYGVDITAIYVPAGAVTLPWRHTTGTLVICKALFGQVELVQMLGDPHGRVPMRQATRTKIGEAETRYLGGPPRIVGDVGPVGGGSLLLEVALKSRSPMLGDGGRMRGFVEDATGYEEAPPMLRIGVPPSGAEPLLMTRQEADERQRAERAKIAAAAAEATEGGEKPAWWTQSGGGIQALKAGVGGLDDQVRQIIRRAFLTRTLPAGTMRDLGLNHVRGMLLYGPPGCGKTLIARLIAESLTDRPVKIVNGPELLDRWVGEAERNVRGLFLDAEDEWINMGELSGLHVIVLDELDALARSRGTLPGDSSGVRDSIVNQLLAKIDGVKDMENVLVIGLTNRKDLIDPALIRPGRLEVHVEIREPGEEGRKEILRLHMGGLRSSGRLGDDAWAYADVLAREGNTGGYTGAELAGLVRCAASYAFDRALGQGQRDADIEVGVADLERAMRESYGAAAGGKVKRALRRVMGR